MAAVTKTKIGLEIHVQLFTQTKLFCGCANKDQKQDTKPNTYTCPYCIGLPGSKPRINEKAVEFAEKIALALNCSFPEESVFSRKSYFYPDMGKNFQITQYEFPVANGGYLEVGKKKFHLRRIQIEEDPARIVHMADGKHATITTAKYVLVDYNRSGVPLVEIVTEPDFSSPEEVRTFMQHLSSMLEYLEVFDPSVEGSMRVDANISTGSARVEIKNISGFREAEKALHYEIIRQRNLTKRKKEVEQETRSWDAAAGVTRSLRTKEQEEEYGYITETDLPIITIDENKTENLRKEMPEFAHEKAERYQKEYGMTEEMAMSITIEPDFSKMFEHVIGYADSKTAARWFAGQIRKTLNYNTMRMKDSKLTAESIVKLLSLVESKKITERTAEMFLRDMVKSGADPEKLVREKKAGRIEDEKTLDYLVKEVLDEHPDAIIDYKSGKKEAFHFLLGEVMRKTQGRADINTVSNLLKKRIS